MQNQPFTRLLGKMAVKRSGFKERYTANLFDSNSIKQIDVNVKLNKHLKLSIQHEAFNFTVMIII